jgi:RHS repeat-associated protein
MKFSEIANRLTGISTPLVGVSWQPTDLEVSAARRVIAFLEDRRVLYAPEEMEVASHCVDSVLEIISALGLRTLAVENRVGSRCTGKERDSESGLDNFGARYDASSMGRFMSADPVFISADRLTDPQSLNLYAYVRNNPLSLVDPTGLDFYLACQTSDHSGCGQVTNGEGGGKSWVQGQTVNGQFQATDVDMNDSKDASAGYHDQFGNQYTGSFDQNNGVSFTNTATGDTSGHSRFIDGSDETDVNGATSGAFNGIQGRFFDACGGSCEGRASLYETTPGAFASAEAALHKQGGFMNAIDLLSGAHKSGAQWKDSSGYVHMLNPSGQMEMHFEGHPTGVDVQQFVLHMVDTIRDATSGRAAAEKNAPLP